MTNPTEQPKNPQLSQEEVLDQLSENKSQGPSVLEMPPPIPPPGVEVTPVNQPKAPATQKKIPSDLQLEAVGKRICKNKGHKIIAVNLRDTQIIKDAVALPIEKTIVICEQCGASLAQIRG